MKFESVALLILLIVIAVGGFYTTHKIDDLENELSQQVVDTVTVEVPLTEFDTTYVTMSDTVYADADTIVVYSDTLYTEADTVYSDSSIVIHKYGTYKSSFNTPLVYGFAAVNTRHGKWKWEIKHRNLKLRLEFPDKYDFRKVIVTTIPNLGHPVDVSLNSEYKPLKKSHGFSLAVGAGFNYNREAFFMGDISWKVNRIGVTSGKGGWGYYYTRTLWSF